MAPPGSDAPATTGPSGTGSTRAGFWLVPASLTAVVVAALALVMRSDVTTALVVVDRASAFTVERPGGTGPGRGALAAASPLRWITLDLAATWQRVPGPSGDLTRSPHLDLEALDDIQAVVIEVAPAAGRPLLLWSDQPALTPGDYARNRRALPSFADRARTFVLSGKELRGEQPGPPHYLFLQSAPGPNPAVLSVSVVMREGRPPDAGHDQLRSLGYVR